MIDICCFAKCINHSLRTLIATIVTISVLFLLAPAVHASEESPPPAEAPSPEELVSTDEPEAEMGGETGETENTSDESNPEQSETAHEGQTSESENGNPDPSNLEESDEITNPPEVIDENQSDESEEASQADNPEAADDQTISEEAVAGQTEEQTRPEETVPEPIKEQTITEETGGGQSEDEVEQQSAQPSDPYFFVSGVKHSFLPSHGSCEGVQNYRNNADGPYFTLGCHDSLAAKRHVAKHELLVSTGASRSGQRIRSAHTCRPACYARFRYIQPLV